MTGKTSLAAIGLLCFSLGACAQEVTPGSGKQPLAVVGGTPIYEEELLPLVNGQMQQLRFKEYEIKSQVLDNLVNQKILEAEAKKKGTTAEKLIQQEVDSKVAEPGNAELEAFYTANKDQINRPLNEIKTQLRDAVKQTKVQQARQEYIQRLRGESKVSVFLTPPRLNVDYDPARVRGDAKAPITMVEFSDFQCPFCSRVNSTLREVLAKYSGRVKLAYRDFPLRQGHPQAQLAAEASRCAGAQGKFWEYHDLLFANPGELAEAGLLKHASTLKMDRSSFESCLSSGKFNDSIEEDLQAGVTAGVTGTPAFFINGIFLNGAQPTAAFEKVIEAELARTSKTTAGGEMR